MSIEEIIENFELLDDWEDRYKYLIELGNLLPEFSQSSQTDEKKVQGCVSQVWIDYTASSSESDPVIDFVGTSDAHIVRGLIAVTLSIFSGKKASEIENLDEQVLFAKMELSEHITPQRSNGLKSMVVRIKDIARASRTELT